MKFPSGALANCSTSYAHHTVSRAIIQTEKSVITLDPAYSYGGLRMQIRAARQPEQNVELPQINQFAAEMDHFAECILQNRTPRTAGEDGMQDVKIMRKLYDAADSGKTIAL